MNCTYWIESAEARAFLGITMTTELAEASQPMESVPDGVKMDTVRGVKIFISSLYNNEQTFKYTNIRL